MPKLKLTPQQREDLMRSPAKPMPVEKLIRWALFEEIPRGRPLSMSAWDAVVSYGRLGTRIQTSHNSGYGAGDMVPGEPHADALLIAGALRALGDIEMTISFEECLDVLGHLSEIGYAAARAIAGLSFNALPLIYRHAVVGGAPEWDIGHPVVEKVRYSNGKPIIFGLDGEGALIELAGRYSLLAMPRAHLEWSSPSVIEVLESRIEYLVWRRGLDRVHQALVKIDLREHIPLPSELSTKPWVTGDAPRSRVLPAHAFADQPTERLPLHPKRKAPGKPIESKIERASRLARQKSTRDVDLKSV